MSIDINRPGITFGCLILMLCVFEGGGGGVHSTYISYNYCYIFVKYCDKYEAERLL